MNFLYIALLLILSILIGLLINKFFKRKKNKDFADRAAIISAVVILVLGTIFIHQGGMNRISKKIDNKLDFGDTPYIVSTDCSIVLPKSDLPNIVESKSIKINKCRMVNYSGKTVPIDRPYAKVGYDFSVLIPVDTFKYILKNFPHSENVETYDFRRYVKTPNVYSSETDLMNQFYDDEIKEMSKSKVYVSFFHTISKGNVLGFYYNSSLPNEGNVLTIMTYTKND